MTTLGNALQTCGLVAILRGLEAERAAAIGEVLASNGFRVLEVPLNRPGALDAIGTLAERFGADCVIGAGTVMSVEAVDRVADRGGRLIVMPHGDTAVVARAKARGLWCLPGVATPTEGFACLAAGADGLKLFPAEMLPPSVVKAWTAVLPPDLPLLPVGGITPETMRPYFEAGAGGFGLGSALFAPGRPIDEVADRAKQFIAEWRRLTGDDAG